MRSKLFIPYIIVFGLITLAEMVGEHVFHSGGSSILLFVTKPLLMPVLIILLAKATRLKQAFDKLMLIGLGFGWLGDVFLMFNNNDLFVFGLASFLICHILYIFAFINNIRKSSYTLSFINRFILGILPLFYLIVIYSYLYSYITKNPLFEPFLIPVSVYCIAIFTMSLFALWRIGSTNRQSAALIIGGAFIFMLSDSLIALNKFVHPFEHANLYIMFLYCLAQLLFVLGTIQHYKPGK